VSAQSSLHFSRDSATPYGMQQAVDSCSHSLRIFNASSSTLAPSCQVCASACCERGLLRPGSPEHSPYTRQGYTRSPPEQSAKREHAAHCHHKPTGPRLSCHHLFPPGLWLTARYSRLWRRQPRFD
jgi:hypothetical protein